MRRSFNVTILVRVTEWRPCRLYFFSWRVLARPPPPPRVHDKRSYGYRVVFFLVVVVFVVIVVVLIMQILQGNPTINVTTRKICKVAYYKKERGKVRKKKKILLKTINKQIWRPSLSARDEKAPGVIIVTVLLQTESNRLFTRKKTLLFGSLYSPLDRKYCVSDPVNPFNGRFYFTGVFRFFLILLNTLKR